MNIFYVYSFTEPGKDIPFYIGKGYGDRIYQHFHKTKIRKQLPFYTKLREMLLNNQYPEIIKIKENISEHEALEFEAELISNAPKDSLLNIKRGGGKESKLTYIPGEHLNNQDIQTVIKRAVGYIKRNMTMKYNEKKMYAFMLTHPEIDAEFHKELANTNDEESVVLEKVYYKLIHESNKYKDQWTAEELPVEYIGNLSQVSADIEKLINVHGWSNFITGLSDYANKKEIAVRRCGMITRAEDWERIKIKLHNIRKNVRE